MSHYFYKLYDATPPLFEGKLGGKNINIFLKIKLQYKTFETTRLFTKKTE
jgi:hypothetical protein